MIPTATRTKVRYTFRARKEPLTVVVNLAGKKDIPVVVNPGDEISLVSGDPRIDAIDGSLIRQSLKNGQIYGCDYDGRLGKIEAHLFLQGIYNRGIKPW